MPGRHRRSAWLQIKCCPSRTDLPTGSWVTLIQFSCSTRANWLTFQSLFAWCLEACPPKTWHLHYYFNISVKFIIALLQLIGSNVEFMRLRANISLKPLSTKITNHRGQKFLMLRKSSPTQNSKVNFVGHNNKFVNTYSNSGIFKNLLASESIMFSA